MGRYKERLESADSEQSVIQMDRKSVVNVPCCFSLLVFIISVMALSAGLICFLYLFAHAIPLHQYAKYYDKTIVESDLCYLRNKTSVIETKQSTRVALYVEVKHEINSFEQEEAKSLAPILCGRYLIAHSLNSSTVERPEIVSKLKIKYPKDACIQLIDNSTYFNCWFNSEETTLSDPRYTSKELSQLRTQKIASALAGCILLIISIVTTIASGIVVCKNNKKNMSDTGRKGTKVFSTLLLGSVGLQVCFAVSCFMFPFLGWLLWPIGTYVGFIIFAVFLVFSFVVLVVIVLGLLLFRIAFESQLKMFRVLAIVTLSLVIVFIVYQIAMIYPIGIWGLQYLAKFRVFM